MASYKQLYREVFQTFGYPLTERTAVSPGVLAEAEKRLGVRVPPALRDYYLVAGRERRFNVCCDMLLKPSEWTVSKQRLVFMVENQAVCRWGVSVRNPDAADPPVSESALDEDAEESASWYSVHRKCSAFLVAMLHHQALSGGLPHYVSQLGNPSRHHDIHFDRHAWVDRGELKGERYYSRPQQVLSLSFFDLPFGSGWEISAAAKTKRDLQAIRAELGLSVR